MRRASGLGLGLLLGMLTACDTPVPALQLQLSSGPSQACPSTACSDVDLGCESWLSIRIIDPAEPGAPFLSQCTQVLPNGGKDVCVLGSIDLEATPLPIRDLEVQVAVYPASMITFGEDGVASCPVGTTYDAADGFPVEGAVTPALGGRAFYRPGDGLVTVTLGCTDLSVVNDPVCIGAGAGVEVLATVEDFDLRLPVDLGLADRLAVGVGEPRVKDNQFVLNPGDLTPLARTSPGSVAWAGDFEGLFTSTACLTVLDDAPQSTTTLTCQRATVVSDRLTFAGTHLSSSSLEQILTAVGLTQFPTQGITIGLVLDVNGEPVPGQAVVAPGATLQYLSADRSSLVPTGTTTSGIFVSQDAPFGTPFTAARGAIAAATGLGGLVVGKVTITILRFDDPIVGG